MKLDRNTNPDGQGKYALIQLRKVREIRDAQGGGMPMDIYSALEVLGRNGRDVLHWGDEGDGEQFFVVKYKDKFAAAALAAYASAVDEEAKAIFQKVVEMDAGESSCGADAKGKRERMIEQCDSLQKYRDEILLEWEAARRGTRIPD